MEIGIFSRTYEYNSPEETFRRMSEHGIFHTQLNLSNAGMPSMPEEIDWDKLNALKAAALKYGIHLDALSGTFNMIAPDTDEREQGCRQFAVQCGIAHELGIPVVSLCTGSKNPHSKWKWHDDNLSSAAWTDLMRSTERVLRCAEENDVILGVETEASNIVNTAQRARKYLDEAGSDRLKIIMDGANLFHSDQLDNMRGVLDEAFALLGPDIVLAHAKDLCLKGDVAFVAVGEGILNFEYYIGLLRRAGYTSALMMHGLSEEQVPSSRDYLLEIIRGGK